MVSPTVTSSRPAIEQIVAGPADAISVYVQTGVASIL